MYFKRLDHKTLENRIDADFYNPSLLALREKVISKFPTSSLKKESKRMNSGPFGSALLASSYVSKQEGMLFVRPQDCKDLLVDTNNDNVFISFDDHKRLKSSQFKTGDIIITKIGNGIGDMAVVPKSINECNISGNAMGVELNNHDSYFAIAFLRSKYGQADVIRGLSGGAKPKIDMEAIGNIIFPLMSPVVEKYIGDKVRQAELLREWVKSIDEEITKSFSELVPTQKKESKIYWVKSADVDSYRINPKQYDPVVVDILKQCKSSLDNLESLLDERGISGGATPKGARYQNEGILFCRVQNVKKYSLDLSDSVYIDDETNALLTRSECLENDLILTITGYPGVTSLVTKYDLPLNINQHSVRLGVNNKISAGYLCAALNSDFLKLQVERSAIGGTRDALDYPSVLNLQIPRFDSLKESKINECVISFISASKISTKLIKLSKYIVEGVIEGRITEDELIQAQNALEQGDNTLDRAILSKMTDHGYAVAGSKPLFADLDEFYELLEQAKELE